MDTGLHQRVPQQGWRRAGPVVPARSPRQVVEGQIVVICERFVTKAGDVTLEIDSCQALAIGECPGPNGSDAVGDGDAGQVAQSENALFPMLVTLLGTV